MFYLYNSLAYILYGLLYSVFYDSIMKHDEDNVCMVRASRHNSSYSQTWQI